MPQLFLLSLIYTAFISLGLPDGVVGVAWPQAFAGGGLLLLGLGCAPIYPSLMHEAAQRFDADTAARVIGRQVGSAYIGCVLLPAGLGLVGATWGLWLIMPGIALLALALLWASEALNRMT